MQRNQMYFDYDVDGSTGKEIMDEFQGKWDEDRIYIRQYMRDKAYSYYPGPPHWDGDEGGCLGLPTDVAKLILKWI